MDTCTRARMNNREAREDAPPVDPDLVSLVQLAMVGDQRARAGLYERFGSYVHGVALSYADPDDADDIVQDAFVRAFDRLRALREPAAFGSWLAQIARNLARMKRRRDLRLAPIDDQTPAPDRSSDAVDGVEILAAIRSLPEAYRETLMLRLVEQLSGEEIASRTGMTHGSVRVNLSRGMTLLRAKLGGTK